MLTRIYNILGPRMIVLLLVVALIFFATPADAETHDRVNRVPGLVAALKYRIHHAKAVEAGERMVEAGRALYSQEDVRIG